MRDLGWRSRNGKINIKLDRLFEDTPRKFASAFAKIGINHLGYTIRALSIENETQLNLYVFTQITTGLLNKCTFQLHNVFSE